MTLYFTYVIKALTYNRGDVRVLRSTGEKRRNVWSEMLTVIFPFIWSINLISNAFAYLRVLEGNGGYTFLSVQVIGYQWGWEYTFSNSFYPKFWNHPIKLGKNITYSRSSAGYLPIDKTDTSWHTPAANDANSALELHDTHNVLFENLGTTNKSSYPEVLPDNTWDLPENSNSWTEIYITRSWLKNTGVLEQFSQRDIKNAIYQTNNTYRAQGLEAYAPQQNKLTLTSSEVIQDKLRLFRSTNALVLPTRVTLRIMSTSNDITHSWAIPGLGIKMDCVPGRLFCLFINLGRDGVYYGQCSELCGWNHFNMPVVLYALPLEHFVVWWETFMQSQIIDNTLTRNNITKSYELSIAKFK